MNELISIIIPTYNRAHLIHETLDSVLNQSYGNWECLIIDDFSDDSTLSILQKYKEKDNRFRFYIKSEKDRKGASSSRNIGLKNTRGSYIQFLDSDDLIASNKLEEQLKIVSNNKNNNIITCKWGFFSNEKDHEVYAVNPFYRNFDSPLEYLQLVGKYGGYFPLHCFLIPTKIIKKAGFWSEDLSLSDDSEFIFRVIINSDKILYSKDTNVLYRINNPESLSTKKDFNKARSLILSWQKIENSYLNTFGDKESGYLNKKKQEVYKSIKHSYPGLIRKNKVFFEKQIKLDDDKFYIKLYYKKARNKILYLIHKFIK